MCAKLLLFLQTIVIWKTRSIGVKYDFHLASSCTISKYSIILTASTSWKNFPSSCREALIIIFGDKEMSFQIIRLHQRWIEKKANTHYECLLFRALLSQAVVPIIPLTITINQLYDKNKITHHLLDY